jgi:cation:H+ antiporter
MTYLILAAGLVLLLAGGEALVRGSVAAASRLGVSKLVIGLTLVGFGTSTPELAASLDAALSGAPGVAIGNVVGSNIANILLILGLSAVLLPVATRPAAFRRDGAALALASLLLLGVCWLGVLSRPAGLVLLAILAAYTLHTYRSERRAAASPSARMHAAEAEEVAAPALSMPAALALTAGGIVAIVLGADLLVGAALTLARAAGISETVIGLTLVAVGTSLPELATSVTAAIRRHGDVAFGNVVGSNIFNILGIAGTTALVSPIPIPAQILAFDIWAMLAATAALIAFAVTGWRVTRTEGAVLLAAYAAYLAVQLHPGLRGALGL